MSEYRTSPSYYQTQCKGGGQASREGQARRGREGWEPGREREEEG